MPSDRLRLASATVPRLPNGSTTAMPAFSAGDSNLSGHLMEDALFRHGPEFYVLSMSEKRNI